MSIPVPKPVAFDNSGRFSGNLFTASFHAIPFSGALGDDAIYSVTPSGAVNTFSGGHTGVEMLTFGDGGRFGSDLFVSTIGRLDVDQDGSVFTLDPAGHQRPFIGGVDASVIVFDTARVLGGGAFVIDALNNQSVMSIWHITAVPEPGVLCMIALGLFLMTARRYQRPSSRGTHA